MSLPASASTRVLKHQRRLDVQVYARDDGLWEVDAQLVDVKTRDVPLASGIRPAGTPIHEMRLRLIVDRHFDILQAGSETTWMPYPGHCEDHDDAYGRLVGLNLLKGFRQGLRERVGGAKACTHITELAQVLPTAVIQAFAGEVLDTRGEQGTKPFQIDRCHALRSDGPAVARFYPRWHHPGGSDTPG